MITVYCHQVLQYALDILKGAIAYGAVLLIDHLSVGAVTVIRCTFIIFTQTEAHFTQTVNA